MAPVVPRLTIAVFLLLFFTSVVEGKECAAKELKVFEEVAPQVRACTQTSGLSFQMPPQTSLPKTAQTKLCKTPSCTHLLGLVNDLNLPRCEVFFDNRNVTLQKGIDSFASLCDNVSPSPLPLKKKKPSSSSSGSSSSSSSYDRKRKEKVSSAMKDATSSTSRLVFIIAASLALVTPMLL